ncbi:MAG: toprim domain-containing protein [Candidatus Methanomethylicaceae archaeon]|nr:toprim domain-containing protein [Candidatus Verstraetearchaeota archaeon]
MKSFKYYSELLWEIKTIIDSMNSILSLIIVEGKNDEKALREIGLRVPIYRFRESGLSNIIFVDEISNNFKGKKIAILLDFDNEGQEMAEYLSRELEERGVKVERYFRKILKEILIKEGIRHIEEIRVIKTKANIG